MLIPLEGIMRGGGSVIEDTGKVIVTVLGNSKGEICKSG